MKKGKRNFSIIYEVAALFLIGVITTGILTYVIQNRLSNDNVKAQTEDHAEDVATEVTYALTEYPAYKWLIQYWYEHADTLDIEYDVIFSGNTRTAKKNKWLTERHPGLQLRYMTEEECEALPADDQNLYAEVTYSWLITRINEIKRSYDIDYLFCVISKEPFDQQFFLMSAANRGAVRGTDYEEVYPLGHVVTVAESQTEAMRSATKDSNYLAAAGDYVDYYALLCTIDDYNVLIGLTYDNSDLTANAAEQTKIETRAAIMNQISLSVVCLALILLFVIHPLQDVQSIIRKYKENKNSEKAIQKLSQVRAQNEIGRLAEDVSEMIEEIDVHMGEIQTITAEKERISTELSLAAKIQADMLPNIFPAFPDRTEFDIYGVMDPAKEVGGDFYDFYMIDEDHLCLEIADVSGKGVPAALFMMSTQIILANNAMMGKYASRILHDTNNAICDHNKEDMFVTVWLGILEISTGKLYAANAGHEYPAIQRHDGKFELLKDKHGLVIGFLPDMEYEEYEIQLEPGDKIFVYTDGVPEAMTKDREMYGTDRMVDALNENLQESPEGILKAVRRSVDAFVKGAEQFDDLTMLCLEYRGESEAKE